MLLSRKKSAPNTVKTLSDRYKITPSKPPRGVEGRRRIINVVF